jgi:hypothetical protein
MRATAAFALVAFLSLAVMDMFVCGDGCRDAHSPQAADHSCADGGCPLCSGAILQAPTAIALIPLARVERAVDPTVALSLTRPSPPVDRPPRVS